jgi:hypothetical protein
MLIGGDKRSASRRVVAGAGLKQSKVFWFFFSKKNMLSFLPLLKDPSAGHSSRAALIC